MGATFSSIQIRSASQEAIIEGLNGLLKEPTYVSPAVGGWVGVYPEGAEATETLAPELSRRLSTAVLDWSVYDSDVFTYSLYESGELRDEFNSSPHYFEGHYAEGDDENEQEKIDPARVQGDPRALLPYCIPGTTLAAIKEVLHPIELVEPDPALAAQLPGFPDAGFQQLAEMLGTTADALKQGVEQKGREKYVFAEHQAVDLAKLLGMDEDLASAGFRYIEQDDIHDHSTEIFCLIGNEALSQEYKNRKLWNSFRVDDLEAAVKMGAEVNVRDVEGVPLLARVARYCISEAMQFLIGRGADVNMATHESPHFQYGLGMEAGVTPLMVAAGASREHPMHQLETVQLLLDAGADINARSETGRSALGEAMKMTDPAQHQGRIGRRAPEEVLRQAAAQSAQVVEMLRAAGATE